MRHLESSFRHLLFACAILGIWMLVLPSGNAGADDTDLVRENTAKPFVFFLVDTSSSMNLDIASGTALPLDGDDPRSRIYQVKKVLYEVLIDEANVNYGFATYNQDDVHVRGKHWLYRPTTSLKWDAGTLEFAYPTEDDPQVFGTRFLQLDGTTLEALDPPTEVPAGSCASPLDLDDAVGRRMMNRFSKLGEPGSEASTTIWFTTGSGGNATTFQLVVTLGTAADTDGDGIVDTNSVGVPTLLADFSLFEVPDCSQLPVQVGAAQTLALRRVGEFLMHDQPAGGNADEATQGDWTWTDVFANGVNGTSTPFSGKGIEGNYDSPFSVADPDLNVTADQQLLDDFCAGTNEQGDCVDPRLKFTTFASSTLGNARELDRGDLLPWDWNGDNRGDFLTRLNPNHPTGNPPEFATAPYFADARELLDGPGTQDETHIPLRFTVDALGNRVGLTVPPMLPFGFSPLARAINDFRCWYNGTDNDQKCRDDGERPWDEGWRFIAADNDALATCRRPFLIVISDGEDTSPSGATGENASADVGNLLKQSGEPGVQTWVFNLGSLNNCQGNGELNSIANAGKTDPKVENCITVNSPSNLEDRLREVLGRIVEETRSFASAAVPTVQADEGDKLFLTQFRPARGRSIWRGRVLGFLKPVPLTDPPERQPRTDIACVPGSVESGCFLWDAGEVMLGQVNASAPVGPDTNQRRVYYSRTRDSLGLPVSNGEWALHREPFDDPLRGVDLTTTTPLSPPVSSQEVDLWRGLSIPFDLSDAADVLTARETTRTVIDNTYAVKSHTFGTDAAPTDYILGDVFHSNPLVIGAPVNARFFADNNNGYRDFARQHENRRSVLIFGANDGMLHAFDAGVFDPGPDEFTDGTGKEIFAFVPRGVMPSVKSMSNFNSPRLWGVDGTFNAVDVFIDPVYSLAPDPADREWRTVLVGGLRRGGESYFALDVTQPDRLVDAGDGTLVPDNSPAPEIPNCQNATGNPSDNDSLTACHGELGYPAPLWEFDDSVVLLDGTRVRLDEDPIGTPGHGAIDLAQSWSVPNLGRMRVRQADAAGVLQEITKHVAIFGGGIDPSNQAGRGNYLYIVDIETGQAIYKVPLEGAAPAEPAAVDTDQNGELDRIYIGTLAGFLYRVDLVGPNGELPTLGRVPVPGVPDQLRIQLGLGDPWVPRKIFDTTEDITFTDTDGSQQTLTISRPIYFRPSVIFIAELGEFALAFGTGNRENLWGGNDTIEGRFYIFVDETAGFDPADLPITQDDLFPIVADDPSPDPSDPNDPINNNPQAANPLIVPGSSGVRGWFFELQPKERVVTNAFALSGITVFSTFIPRVDPAIGADGGPACALRGVSRAFAVFTTNGVGTLFDQDGVRVRNIEVSSLATEAFVERGQTKNPAQEGENTSDALSAQLERVMQELMTLFPQNCRFANYRLDIKTISANTGVVHIAPVPVCIIEKNWREF